MPTLARYARKNSGIDRFHFHLLPHISATKFLLAGGDAFELQARQGHESLETTRRYVHPAQQMAQTQRGIEIRRPSPLDAMAFDPSRTRSRRRGRPWGQEEENYAAPPAEARGRKRKAGRCLTLRTIEAGRANGAEQPMFPGPFGLLCIGLFPH